MKWRLYIAGDPIEDIYITLNSKMETIKIETVPGGASNVYHNAKSILNFKQVFSIFPPTKEKYKIIRTNKFDYDLKLSESSERRNFYSNTISAFSMINQIQFHTVESGLILSDYNKGFLNQNLTKSNPTKRFKFLIVDSRYRSLNLSFLNYADLKILRCTGKEYVPEWASQFDYTIWSDAARPILLLDKKQNIIAELQVPDIPFVDTCGAGDTFTASLGAFLLTQPRIDTMVLKNALKFSLECCQEVIQKHGTAITTKKLK